MTSTSHCFEKFDLNPERCTFVKKCPEGTRRNKNFRCVKAISNTNVVKKIVEKRKSGVEKRLRDRTEILRSRTDKFFNNGNMTENSNSNIKDALMRLRKQTKEKDMIDLTEDLTGMIDRIKEFRKSKRSTKTRTPRKKKVVINTGLNEFNSFEEDLRSASPKSASKSPSKSPEAVEVDLNAVNSQAVNSPDSPREMTEEQKQKIVNAYANQVSKMRSMLNFGKLEQMTKRTRKPKATLKSRKNASNKPSRRKKIGTSLNGPKPRRKKTSKASPTGSVEL
jgi:hypothetical protein